VDPGGVVVLHDSQGYPGREDFGVGRLLAELRKDPLVMELVSPARRAVPDSDRMGRRQRPWPHLDAHDRNVMGRAGDQLTGPALAGVRRTA